MYPWEFDLCDPAHEDGRTGGVHLQVLGTVFLISGSNQKRRPVCRRSPRDPTRLFDLLPWIHPHHCADPSTFISEWGTGSNPSVSIGTPRYVSYVCRHQARTPGAGRREHVNADRAGSASTAEQVRVMTWSADSLSGLSAERMCVLAVVAGDRRRSDAMLLGGFSAPQARISVGSSPLTAVHNPVHKPVDMPVDNFVDRTAGPEMAERADPSGNPEFGLERVS